MACPDIVCRRDARGLAIVEGARRQWALHSPTGFEWGYGGPGPSGLALALLWLVTAERDFAASHHQDFKRRFVEPLPAEGGVIRGADIDTWISERGYVPPPAEYW